MGDLRIITRGEWGASPPKSTANMKDKATYVFIHHTAGGFCSSTNECKARVKSIQSFHMDPKPKGNGWDDIGYNFLVGEDGNIYEGRGWDRVGAHTLGYNDVGIAFSFIGTFTNRKPNDAALKAVKNAIEFGVNTGKISSAYTLRGHRDMGSTECPGDQLYHEIRTWAHY